MRTGDGILTTNVRDEREHGWVGYKAPKGTRFVFLLLGTVERDATEVDIDERLNALGWHFISTDDPESMVERVALAMFKAHTERWHVPPQAWEDISEEGQTEWFKRAYDAVAAIATPPLPTPRTQP